MKKTLFFIFLSISITLNSQTNTDYLKEINRDIWLPYRGLWRFECGKI